MAAGLYAKGRNAFLTGAINWSSATLKVALVGSGYVADMHADQYYSTVSPSVIGTPIALSSVTAFEGIAGAASITSGTLSTGSTVTQLVVYSDTGTASTSPLISRMDVASTPTNGGTITITFSSTVLSITAAAQSGSNTTYTYSVSSGIGFGVGHTVVVTGMTNGGNNGTFTVASMTGSTFTVSNASGVTASTQTGSGTISNLIFEL